MIKRDEAQLKIIDATLRHILLGEPCDCIFNRAAWRIVAEMATGDLEDRAASVIASVDQDEARLRGEGGPS